MKNRHHMAIYKEDFCSNWDEYSPEADEIDSVDLTVSHILSN